MLHITYVDGRVVRIGVDASGRGTISESGTVRRMHLERDGLGEQLDVTRPHSPRVREGDAVQLTPEQRDWFLGQNQPVWTETWEAEDGLVKPLGWASDQGRFWWEQESYVGAFGNVHNVYKAEPRDAERAKLAAQAPAMARLLRDVRYDRFGQCVSCGAAQVHGCGKTCALVRVLHDAGALP